MAKKKSSKSKGDALLDELLGMPKKLKTKKGRKKVFFQLVLYSILWIGLIVSLFYQNTIDKAMNKTEFNFDSSIVSSDYKVHFIDVGQGDCSLIQFPDGKNMMIDTGESSSKNNLVRYLDALEVTQIDYLILTHPDSDHIGNAVTVFETYDIISVYLPPIYSKYDVDNGFVDSTNGYKTKTTASWNNVVKAVYNEKDSNVLKELKYNEEHSEITGTDDSSNVLYTIDMYPPKLEDIKDSNGYSPFIFITIGTDKFMFAGDADFDDEKNFLANNATKVADNFFDCSVLKVGHHGSATSTSTEFLNAVQPEYAVISCGKGNKYGHPTEKALNTLNEISGITIKRTDLEGSIVFGTGGTKVVNQSSYNHVSDIYYEWKYFVICGGVLIAICFVLVIRADKKAQQKEERSSKNSKK